MSKEIKYIRKTYPVGWWRTIKPITDEEYEKHQRHMRRLLERSMELVT